MRIIYMPRRGGKTTKAVAWCKKTGAILVVCSRMMANMIHRETGLPTEQLMTHDEFIHRRYDRLRGWHYPTQSGRPELVIDDADMLLRGISEFHIGKITLSRPFTKAECKKYGLPLDGDRT